MGGFSKYVFVFKMKFMYHTNVHNFSTTKNIVFACETQIISNININQFWLESVDSLKIRNGKIIFYYVVNLLKKFIILQ